MDTPKVDYQMAYKQLLDEKAGLEKQNQLLEKQNQIKDKLFHMIGHDLRSPLGSIKMILDFLNQENADEESLDLKSMLPELSDAADEAFYLLENLLYWTRIQTNRISYKPGEIPVQQLINKAVLNMKRSFEQKGITIIQEIEGNQEVFGDEYLLLVILRNLLSNACKFSNRGTPVSIRLSESAGHLTIHLSDQGVGIKAEDMEKIRDPYSLFSTYGTNNENGNGLGLKVCQALAAINKGELRIDTQPGTGTIVRLLLPAGDDSCPHQGKKN